VNAFINTTSNHIKNIAHGFFLGIATAIAEPATILPLMVNHFGGSPALVGFFASLLRGGAVVVQLLAAFNAQSYPLMIPYLRRVFLARFLTWFGIGFFILLLGDEHHTLSLFVLGFGLFAFSFSAGFGAVFFQEIVSKVFTHKFRGKTMAWKQFFAGLGSILSGGIAAWILKTFPAPQSYGYLFIFSALLMSIGLIAFSTVHEPLKQNISEKEKNFRTFLRNGRALLKSDAFLKHQILTYFLSYAYLLSLPFIVLDAKDKIDLGANALGIFISAQMAGAMLSNFLWGKLSSKGNNRATVSLAILLSIVCIAGAFVADTVALYACVFFIIGGSMDGVRLGFGNLIAIIAPEDKRPVYIAIQSNLSSIGIFFSIPGGFLLSLIGYHALYALTLGLLVIALWLSLSLKDLHN